MHSSSIVLYIESVLNHLFLQNDFLAIIKQKIISYVRVDGVKIEFGNEIKLEF